MAETTPRLEDDGQNAISLRHLLVDLFGARVFEDGASRTSERILAYWYEYMPCPPDFEFTVFNTTAQQMILVKDIEFESLCSHHLLPFYGKAHVAYIPHELMVGVSKIPRLVRWLGKRPRVQEELTHDIANYMKEHLKAKGVAVVMKARHTCMSCRGVLAREAWMVTSEMRGVFLTAPAARQEFLEMIR